MNVLHHSQFRALRPVFLTVTVAAWLALGLCVPVFGQIGIGIKFDRPKYLSYEPIQAEITLRNDTGNTLVFDENSKENRLNLTVEDSDGLRVQPRTKTNIIAGLILGSGETRKLRFTLNNLYGMNRPGTYQVTVQVGHVRLSGMYETGPVTVSVISGILVWNREFGLPADNTGDAIASRKVSLLVFPDGKRDLYALQLEDEESVYGVIRLGPCFGGNKPQCEVDAFSNIHVLHLIRPRLVEYRVLDSNFAPKVHRYYTVGETAPKLQRDPEIGQIMVAGGRLAVEGVDYTMEEFAKDGAEKPSGNRLPVAPAATAPVAPANLDVERSTAPLEHAGIRSAAPTPDKNAGMPEKK